jgi:hypothetical protein
MFALYLIPDDERKAEKFQKDLHLRIREKVACFEIKYFSRLVNVTTIIDGELRSAIVAMELKKRQMPQASQLVKQAAFTSGSR